jgi:hypothetical protein
MTVQPAARAAERTFALEGGLSRSLAMGLEGILVIEGAVLHLWIAETSPTWAWIVTALNVATVVWVWREAASRRKARMVVREHDVEITAGSARFRFARSAVASVEAATWRSVPDTPSDFVNMARPLDPNVVVTLTKPIDGRLALGVTKRVSRFGLRVSDAGALMALLCG